LILGVIVGLILYPMRENLFVKTYLIGFLFSFVGEGFIRAIRMVVVPLIFCSLSVGAAGMEDVAKLGRVGIKIISFYLVTTAIAIILALGFANLTNPGLGLDISQVTKGAVTVTEQTSFTKTLLNLIPVNPVEAMSKGDMLPIIFFALFFGVAMAALGEKASHMRNVLTDANGIVLKIVEIIMLFAPFGVFGLIARTFSTLGYVALLPLAKYVVSVIIVLFIHLLITYQGILVLVAKYNPIKFFKNFLPTMVVGFSTSSSNAALPSNLKSMQEKFGVSKAISSFSIPLGATINMDGTAIMQGVGTVFIAQVYGIDLTFMNYLTVILTATLASIGTAGVPGVGVVMLGMVLSAIGLPLEGIALLMGVDRLVDMFRTTINITGDAVCTLAVAKSEGETLLSE
ncbi:MAG: dicarboxylate/amino acid:cation symporter, partial [Fusobacteriaceae bacterium]